MYSRSEKMKVLFTSKPQAMMSFAFSTAKRWHSSSVRSFHRYFSSSVNWITRGMSNASCNHLQQESQFRLQLDNQNLRLCFSDLTLAFAFNSSLWLINILEGELTWWRWRGWGDRHAWPLTTDLCQCKGRRTCASHTHQAPDAYLCREQR